MSIAPGQRLGRRRTRIRIPSGVVAGPSAFRAAVLADNPISYLRVGEPSGTSAADEQGVNTGTYQGAVTLGAASLLTSDSNTALSLPGASTAYLLLKATKLLAGLTNWSIEFLIKRNGASVTSAAAVYSERGAAGLDILKVAIGNAGGTGNFTTLVYRDDAGVLNTVTGASSIVDNVSHHVVVTKSGTAVVLYRDGVTDGAGGTLTAGNTFTDTMDTRIGSDQQDAPSAQAMIVDEIAVYNTVLSAGRVTAHNAAR